MSCAAVKGFGGKSSKRVKKNDDKSIGKSGQIDRIIDDVLQKDAERIVAAAIEDCRADEKSGLLADALGDDGVNSTTRSSTSDEDVKQKQVVSGDEPDPVRSGEAQRGRVDYVQVSSWASTSAHIQSQTKGASSATVREFSVGDKTSDDDTEEKLGNLQVRDWEWEGHDQPLFERLARRLQAMEKQGNLRMAGDIL